jgi:hypothetical protein
MLIGTLHAHTCIGVHGWLASLLAWHCIWTSTASPAARPGARSGGDGAWMHAVSPARRRWRQLHGSGRRWAACSGLADGVDMPPMGLALVPCYTQATPILLPSTLSVG